MKNLYIGLIFVVGLSACGSKDDGAKPSEAAANFSDAPAGQFTKSADQSNLPDDVGRCDGEVSLDALLKVNQKFETQEYHHGLPMVTGTANKTVLEINVPKKQVKWRHEGKLLGNSEPAWLNVLCTQTDSSTSCEIVESSDNVKKATGQDDGKTIHLPSCYLDDSDPAKVKQAQVSTERGSYKFKSGKVISALRVSRDEVGPIHCWDAASDKFVSRGSGVIKSVDIRSDEVPDVSSGFTCSTYRRVFEYKKVELDSGELLEGSRFEIINGQF